MGAPIVATRVLIVNDNKDVGFNYGPVLNGLGDITHDISAFFLNPYNFKLVQFTGGADVTPSLYGETSPEGWCHANTERDEVEAKIFSKADRCGIKMTGICRGLQFLNVMAGGKMIHHVAGHTGGKHDVSTACETSPGPFEVNSYHHQMCIPPSDAYIIAWSTEKISDVYIGDRDEEMDWYGPEIEALYIPGVRVVGVQWHPEAMQAGAKGRLFYRSFVQDYLEMTAISFRKKYVGASYGSRAIQI
jgi:GMP synthase-like glutamine amidotransferase